MKQRDNIKFERTSKGFTGSLSTSNTFVLAVGTTKKEVRKEIRRTLREF